MKRSMLVATAILACMAGAAQAEDQRRVQGAATLEDIPPVPADVAEAVQRYQSARPAAFADWLSDGSLLISTRFGAVAQLHRVAAPLAARTQLTFYGEPITGAVRVPGSEQFFFSKDTGGDEWFQLFRMSAGGEPVVFSEPGTRNLSPVVTKDGKRVFWARSSKGTAATAVFAADVADPATRKPVYEDAGAVSVDDVSDDGARLLLNKRISNVETRLLVLDLATGRTTDLTPGAPALFDNGRFVRGGAAVLAVTDRDTDVQRIVEIDVIGGKSRFFTPASKWGVESFEVSPDGRTVAYAVNEDGYSRLKLASTGDRMARPEITLPDGVLGNIEFSPDGSRLALALATPTSPSDVWTADLADGKLTRWTASEIGPLDPKTLSRPQLIRFPSFDRLSVPAFVYRPTNVPANAKTPVLVMIHGGPEGQDRPGFRSSIQYYANQLGATVITPNVRGSTGYGRKYLDMDNGPKREDSVKDIGALIDWVGTQANLDASRIAVIGGSYGGYMVLAAMTHYSDKLAAGVESFGISNWVSFLQNTEAYRRDNRRKEYGDERDPKMRAVFDRISPLANVQKISKPMLIQQGVNDPRVPKSESDQIVAALRARNIPVGYLVFADEGHGWRKKPNQDLALGVETVFLRQVFGTGAKAAD